MADGETIGSAHKYYRVLLKISGESLMGHQAYGCLLYTSDAADE